MRSFSPPASGRTIWRKVWSRARSPLNIAVHCGELGGGLPVAKPAGSASCMAVVQAETQPRLSEWPYT